jgi:hypothetical protein
MGFIAYDCQYCGGGEPRCAFEYHMDEDGNLSKCEGSNMCYEDDCFILIKECIRGSLSAKDIPVLKATYDGYGRCTVEDPTYKFYEFVTEDIVKHKNYRESVVFLVEAICASCYEDHQKKK